VPGLIEYEPGHFAACHYAKEIAAGTHVVDTE